MAMFISIGEDTGVSTTSGIFNQIVESTKSLFKEDEQWCVDEIYTPLEETAQFIVLDYVNSEGFNLFYKYCKQAMEGFPNSERGKQIDTNYIPMIMRDWEEVLQVMREDPRFDKSIELK